MSPTAFLIVIAALFGASAGAVAFVRQLVAGFSGMRPLIVSGAFAIITGGLAFGVVYIAEGLFAAYCLIAGLFLIAGTLHMLAQQRYFIAGSDKVRQLFLGKLTYALGVLCFSLLVFVLIVHFIHGRLDNYMPALLGSLTFFLPLFAVQCYFLAVRIPPAVFKRWTYPPPGVIKDFDDDGKVRLLVTAIELTKTPEDRKRTNFRAKMPEHFVFGEMFYHFINDYNEAQSETPIEVTDGQHQPYEWLFRMRTKWFRPDVVLDPTRSLAQNGVRENSVIICERTSPDFQY